LFKKCTLFKRNTAEPNSDSNEESECSTFKNVQTKLTGAEIDKLISNLENYENNNKKQQAEIGQLLNQILSLKSKYSEVAPIKGKVEKLESQNSLLKEKSNDVRRENDMLVEKIQKLQKKISMEVRVSVSEYEENDTDELFFVEKSPEIDSPSDKGKQVFIKTSNVSRTVSVHEDYLQNEEKRFEEAAEKIMRLEQRIICLQNANNLNSCATCRPLRNHVMKIERQLINLVQERKGQLEELYELKQEALSSAVSEKDAHLAWLEVTGEGNVHTKGTIERLRRERRELLQRMKEENENRMKLLSSLEDTSALFTGPAKISALGALGEPYIDEGDSGGFQSTSSFQSASTGEFGDVQVNQMFSSFSASTHQDDDTESRKSC